MKRKLKGVLGVGLAFMLVASLMVVFAPMAAAADYEENDWGEWGLPSIDEDTDVGPMAVAPDGTIYAAVLDGTWMVQKSEDGGFEWDDTELDDAGGVISQIVVSPNYDDDETFYVAVFNPATVYRCEEAGDANPIALRSIPDPNSISNVLFSIDVWSDDDDNWILAGTDDGVFEIKDAHGGDWIDYQLTGPGIEVAFAPDFDEIEIIWALTNEGASPWDFMLTSTIAPGQWGQVIDPAVITDCAASIWVDMDFPDDYTSDVEDEVPVVFVAATSNSFVDGDSGVFMIEGVEGDGDPTTSESVATQLMDDEAMVSLAISGDIILAGALESPEIYISDDLGASWDDVDKMPTGGDGDAWTHVYMAPGDFDPDDGVAYASTFGAESAFSRSEDGGEVWNQVGLIDTDIEDIEDLAFHPDFPGTPTFMMVTYSDYGTYSLWLTNNGDEDEPDYYRVLCGYDGGAPGNIDGEIYLVEYAQDGDAIYIFGEDDTANCVWKSTDDGQTFGKRRSVTDDAYIYDWVIPDSSTIYAAANIDGFYKSINSGLSWSSTEVDGNGGITANDIALSPDFEDDETILIGDDSGYVYISDDDGDSWEDTGAGLDGTVFVAFDPDYADEDSDGFELIYAVDNNGNGDNAIQVGEEDGDDTEWDVLEDDTNVEGVTGDFYGLQVSADRALYAIADTATYDYDDGDLTGEFAEMTGVVRLLLDESDSVWEYAGTEADTVDPDPYEPEGLWLSAGSNVLWTIDWDDAELWVLEDTLSGQVTLDSPANGAKLDREEVVRISWDELRGADDDYEYRLDEQSGLVVDEAGDDEGFTDDTSINVGVGGSAEYDWKVRVAPGEPWHSRWSDEWTFNTALGPAPWAPTLYTPGGVWQYSGLNVELMPAFSWESAKNSDGYQFVLADNAEFTSPLVNKKTPESAYNLDFELEYNSNYFWRVMAYDGKKAISRWSDIGAFTTIEKAAPGPPAPPPPATVTQPAPAPIVLPTPIPPALLWTIIGIGAILIIAVIVLIVRTRRPV